VKTPDKQQNESNQMLETADKSKFITPTLKEKSEKRGNRLQISIHCGIHYSSD